MQIPENQGNIAVEKPVAQTRFGLPVDSFEVLESVIKKGESFGNILLANGVAYPVIHKIANDFKDVFDVSRIRSGKPYSLFCENREGGKCARYFVYENSLTDFFVFDLQEDAKVNHHQKEVTTEVEKGGGKNQRLFISNVGRKRRIARINDEIGRCVCVDD